MDVSLLPQILCVWRELLVPSPLWGPMSRPSWGSGAGDDAVGSVAAAAAAAAASDTGAASRGMGSTRLRGVGDICNEATEKSATAARAVAAALAAVATGTVGSGGAAGGAKWRAAAAAAGGNASIDNGLDALYPGGTPERCLDPGRLLQPHVWAEFKPKIKAALQTNQRWEGWGDVWEAQEAGEGVIAWEHKSASVNGHLLHTTTYGRNSTRDGSNFLVFYSRGEGDANLVPWAAQAVQLLRMVHPISGLQARICICDFYKCEPHRPDPDLADMVLVCRGGRFDSSCLRYPVLLGMVFAPLVKHSSVQCRRGNPQGEEVISFVPFAFRSMGLR
jgi:hypothetical protein